MGTFDNSMDQVVHQLYESLLDPSALGPAVQAMGRAMGERRVMLLNWNGAVGDPPDIISTFAANGPSFDSFFEQYGGYYHQYDPVKYRWADVAEGDWLQYDGNRSPGEWSRGEFYQDFALGQRVFGWAVLKVAASLPTQPGWAITFIRDTGAQALDTQWLEQMRRQVGPHLRRSLLLRAHLTDLRLLADAGLAALNACRLPLWILEGRGTIRFANEAAQAHLRLPAPLLRDRGGQLGLGPGASALASVQQRWQAMLALEPRLAARQADGLRLPRTDGAPAVVQCLPMPPSVKLLSAWQRPMKMLILHPGGFAPPAGVRLLQAAYGFTPAECRVAGLLIQDLTVAEIAALCQVSAGTVRHQVKALLHKSGCRRQAELVNLLFRLHVFDA